MMNSYLNKSLILLFILCTIISCNDGSNSSEKTEATENSENPTTETTQEDKSETDGPFEVKSGMIQYQDKNLEGEITATNTFYFDNYGNLIKLEETIDGEISTYIYNEATKKGATLFAGRNKASKIFMRQGEISKFVAQRSTSGFTKENDEEILGKNCEVYANNAKTAEGEPKVVYWQHQGITLKEINRLGSGYMFEASSFEEKPIEKTIFSLPNEIELPHDIFE